MPVDSDRENRPSSTRLMFVDDFKGVLVILMIVYHSAYVFHAQQPEVYLFLTKNVIFLHSAFLVVTGFLVGAYYSQRAAKNWLHESRRLAVRATKIAFVLLATNWLVYIVGLFPNSAGFYEALPSWNALGMQLFSISGQSVAFEILAYFVLYLLLAAFTIHLSEWKSGIVMLVFLGLFLIFPGGQTFLMMFMALAGELAGRAYVGNRFQLPVFSKGWLSPWVLLLSRPLFFLGYDQLDKRWEPLLLVLDTLIWWCATLWIVDRISKRTQVSLRGLGAFTLVAYLIQMPIVRLCAVQFQDANPWVGFGLTLLATAAVTLFAVRFTEFMIGRFALAKRGYKIVFG